MRDNIRIISPRHGWSAQKLLRDGYDVKDPYIGNGMPIRIIRELWFTLRLPGRCLWYNKDNVDTGKIIYVFQPLITEHYMKWLCKHNDSSRVILFYGDPVAVSVNPQKLDRIRCELWTCDVEDAHNYNMHLYYGGCYYEDWTVSKQTPDIDIFYIGKDKGRYETISAWKDIFEQKGLSTYFYVVAPRSYIRSKKYRPFMPYTDMLKILGRTKAILHLSRGCQNGITIRVEESLIHRIKLITDCKDITRYDFYNKNNIFILGVDNIDDLPAFLESPFVTPDTVFYKRPFFSDMLDYIINYSDNEKK